MASDPPALDAGTQDAGLAPGGDAAVEVDGGDAGVGPGDAGPTDYGAKGPHEVVIEKNVGERFRNDVADDTCEAFIGGVGGNNPDVDDELTTYPADMDRELYTMFRPPSSRKARSTRCSPGATARARIHCSSPS